MINIPKKMKALVTHGPHDYRLEEVDVPRAGEGEILLKVAACGICAGDIKAYQGGEVFWGNDRKKQYLETPAIGGHEFFGTIVEIGNNLAGKNTYGVADCEFEVGDLVTPEQIAPCGECLFCREKRYSLCIKHDVFGFKYYLNGGFAEYALLPKNALVYKLPKDMPLEKAVLIEPYSCSWHAVERARITTADLVVISGAGPLGLGMITAAAMLKPKRLVSLDLNDDRLATAKNFGADTLINPSKTDVQKEILAMTDNYGCDVYIEATGHSSSVTQGLEMIKKGGRFVEFSVFNDSVTCNWSVVGDDKELDIYGVSLSPRCFPRVIDGIRKGDLKTKDVVTHVIGLDQYEKAFDLCMSGTQSIKVAFKP